MTNKETLKKDYDQAMVRLKLGKISEWDRESIWAYVKSLEESLATGRSSSKPLSVMDLKDIRDAAQRVADHLENNHSRMNPHGLVWNNEDKRHEWVEAKRRIREINGRISKL